MPASTRELLRVNLRLQGANAVMGDIPVELPVSPSSLDVEHEQLTRTVDYTHEGKSITFEVVNKQGTLTELDSTIGGADPIPENIFKRVSRAIFRSCVSARKTRLVKANSFSMIGTA